jgi:hypothetical protein
VTFVGNYPETSGERKRNSQSIGHADDDVTHCITGGKVSFDVFGLWHVRSLMLDTLGWQK